MTTEGRTLSPAEVLHRASHTGHHCPFTEPTTCPEYDDAEQTLADLADGGYCVVPLVGLTERGSDA